MMVNELCPIDIRGMVDGGALLDHAGSVAHGPAAGAALNLEALLLLTCLSAESGQTEHSTQIYLICMQA